MKRNKNWVGHNLKSYGAHIFFFIGHSLLHRQKEKRKATLLLCAALSDIRLGFSGRRQVQHWKGSFLEPTVLIQIPFLLGVLWVVGGQTNYLELSTHRVFIHSFHKYLLSIFYMPTFSPGVTKMNKLGFLPSSGSQSNRKKKFLKL